MNISSVSSFAMQRLDPAEMREKMFNQADTDGSGSLSKSEFSAMLENANQPPPPPGASTASEAPDAETLFAEIDTDGNGEISEAEDTAFAEARDEEMRANFESGRTSEFSGSTNLMQSLLEALQNDDSSTTTASSETDSSATTSSTDAQETKNKLIQELLAKLQENSESYSPNWGMPQSSFGVSLFNTTA